MRSSRAVCRSRTPESAGLRLSELKAEIATEKAMVRAKKQEAILIKKRKSDQIAPEVGADACLPIRPTLSEAELHCMLDDEQAGFEFGTTFDAA